MVLRCDLGAPVKFTEDPFVVPGRLAERHFHGFEKCVKHDHRVVYTNEDILREFGIEVRALEGVDTFEAC